MWRLSCLLNFPLSLPAYAFRLKKFPRSRDVRSCNSRYITPIVTQVIDVRDVKDLSAMLGLSERQIHIRLTKLAPLLSGHIHTGKNNRKLIDDQGFAILQRVIELEKEGIAVDLAVEQVKEELNNGDQISISTDVNRGITAELLEELRRTISRLEEDKRFLQTQLEAKEREIERLHEIIANRLPGRVECSSEGAPFQTDIEYMKQIINAQREEIERLRQELEEVKRPWWQRLFRSGQSQHG